MRDGTYGICEGCGLNIPVARLEAIPETPVCIKCADDIERGMRLPTTAPDFKLAAALETEEEVQSQLDRA
ncbi:MAG: TraR/DksA C4-type zinc finger protein [Candidatus Peribacteraceae bacterium]|nr:TraR/DksA C4-type zinc finger protein [Candidatus Peribacteraceae bacterium]